MRFGYIAQLEYFSIIILSILLFLDQPGNKYEITIDAQSAKRVVSKYDLGKFLIDCLTQPEYYGKTCGICTVYAE